MLFVGINPGVRSAMTGHHFAGPSNRFWKLLYESRLVDESIGHKDDDRLAEWGYGITNLVPRASPGIDDLRPAEYVEGWRALDRKIRRHRPAVVALVGVTLYRAILPLVDGTSGADAADSSGPAARSDPRRPGLRAAESERSQCELQLRRNAGGIPRTETSPEQDGGRVSFMKWFGLEEDAGAPVDSLGEIERALTGLDPREARHVACFAYILHRVARADHEISDEESALIEQLVATRGGLPPDRAALVVRIARTENLRHGGTEDFIVTRECSKQATREQKLALLDCLFAVSAIDRSIRTVEDNEIRRVASELKLDHADYIGVRSAHVAHLASRSGRPTE